MNRTERRRRGGTVKVRSAWACAVFVATGLATGCSREIGSDEATDDVVEERPSLAVAVAESDAGPVFQANLYSERDADLYNRLMVEETAGVGTPVTAIHVEVGTRVSEGQLLARLDDADARLDVALAEPRAQTAASILRRVEELRKTEAVSEAELESAVLESRTADAALEKARLNLSRTEVRAPFAGVVSRRYVRVGDVVDDETPLFRITALAPLRARLLVPESEVAAFGVGERVALRGADGAAGTARVIIVGPTIDPGSGTREVIVELSDVGGFRPGAAVAVERSDSAARGSGTDADPGTAAPTAVGGAR